MQQQTTTEPGNTPKNDKPDDLGSLFLEAFVKITDPETQEVLLETRA